MSLIQATDRDISRFLGLIDILPNGCHYWCGARSRGKGNRKWYSSFHTENHGTVRGHRFSSEVFNKDECPPGYHRDHTCCFSMCVNPAHIEVVTKEVNQWRKMQRCVLSAGGLVTLSPSLVGWNTGLVRVAEAA